METHPVDQPLRRHVHSEGRERVESVLMRPGRLRCYALHRHDKLVHLALDPISKGPLARPSIDICLWTILTAFLVTSLSFLCEFWIKKVC